MESQSEQLPPVRVGIMRPQILDHAATFRVMAYMAKHFNVELFFFITKDIDFDRKTVNALFLNGDKKIHQTIPLPKIIDNHPLVFSGEYGKKFCNSQVIVTLCARCADYITEKRLPNKKPTIFCCRTVALRNF